VTDPDPITRPSERELILYATPTGPLATSCDAYFRAISEIAPTVAQTFPPHCSLTGFFRRTHVRSAGVVDELTRAIADLGPVPDNAVTVDGVRRQPDWVGLELESRWLLRAVRKLIAASEPGPGEDALRPKDWLHLSLAYGIDDLDVHASLAQTMFENPLSAGWSVGLWERLPTGEWRRH
jgi:hypothetical protein